jgi:hypothetical protein
VTVDDWATDVPDVFGDERLLLSETPPWQRAGCVRSVRIFPGTAALSFKQPYDIGNGNDFPSVESTGSTFGHAGSHRNVINPDVARHLSHLKVQSGLSDEERGIVYLPVARRPLILKAAIEKARILPGASIRCGGCGHGHI